MFFYSRRKIIRVPLPTNQTNHNLFFKRHIDLNYNRTGIFFEQILHEVLYLIVEIYSEEKRRDSTTDAESKKNRKLPKTSQAIILCLQSDNLKKLNVKQAIRFRI